MKKTQLIGLLMAAVLVVACSLDAEASSILILTDTGTGITLKCDTSMSFSSTNCSAGAGFSSAVPGGNLIIFGGAVGGFNILSAFVTGEQTATTASVEEQLINVFHTSGTGNLLVDFGVNEFSQPLGPNLFLSASDSATFGQSTTGDQKLLQVWGRATNDLIIPTGTATTISSPCVPGSGFTTSCIGSSPEVTFLRSATNFALTGREVITQSVADILPAGYLAEIKATATPITVPVPEPASALTLGTGILLFLVNRRRGRKYGRR
jgi:hypothetical protein